MWRKDWLCPFQSHWDRDAWKTPWCDNAGLQLLYTLGCSLSLLIQKRMSIASSIAMQDCEQKVIGLNFSWCRKGGNNAPVINWGPLSKVFNPLHQLLQPISPVVPSVEHLPGARLYWVGNHPLFKHGKLMENNSSAAVFQRVEIEPQSQTTAKNKTRNFYHNSLCLREHTEVDCRLIKARWLIWCTHVWDYWKQTGSLSRILLKMRFNCLQPTKVKYLVNRYMWLGIFKLLLAVLFWTKG